jgi:hypothetical protein
MFETLMGGLEYLGDAINKPGRAVRGALAGKPEEALAFVPFSDSMGITDQANATSGKDLLRALGADPGEGLGGDIAGFATEVATDPLTLLGVGAGAQLGTKAAAAGMARGPRYGTTVDDVERMIATKMEATPARPPGSFIGSDNPGLDRLTEFKDLPPNVQSRMLSEIPPDSSFLGAGAEGMAFRTPAGDVARFGPVPGGELGRPIAPGVLPASRTVDMAVPGGGKFPIKARVERTPFAQGVGDPTSLQAEDALHEILKPSRLGYDDVKAGNMGFLGGKPVVTDPGSVTDLGFRGPRAAVTNAGQDPGALMSLLIRLGGGDNAVRAAIDAGRARPNMALPLGIYGGGAGANLGAFGRAFGG